MVKKPYLIQRCSINKPIEQYRDKLLSEALDFDYMGSTEFEIGKARESLLFIRRNYSEAKTVLHPKINHGFHALRVFHVFNDVDWSTYADYLVQLRHDQIHLKENSKFQLHTLKSIREIDFWWDIENSVMWSFNKPFMTQIDAYLQKSFEFIDQQIKNKV